MNTVSDAIRYVGVNDHQVDLFEGQYVVPNGMSYNSYVILDEKIAVMDTVDIHFTHEWLDNLTATFGGRTPDYLVIQHMEPDHSANIANFLKTWPNTTIVATEKAFAMMENFFDKELLTNRQPVKEGDSLCLGSHVLHFVCAPMVHWPEVMFTYESTEKILFSADGFGKFGAVDTDSNTESGWDDEARRYYIGIVGKYGAQVQAVLKKAAGLDIQTICPLHGPVLKENLGHYLNKYHIWSSYAAETEGILIAYTSVYGNTAAVAERLAIMLKERGVENVTMHSMTVEHPSYAVADAFRFTNIVFASTTYNNALHPSMSSTIEDMEIMAVQNRRYSVIGNGSWAPQADRIIEERVSGMKGMTKVGETLTIKSSLAPEQVPELEALADAIAASVSEN